MDKKTGKPSMAHQAKKDVLMSLKKMAQEMISNDLESGEDAPKGIMAEVKVKKVSPKDIMAKIHGDSEGSDMESEEDPMKRLMSPSSEYMDDSMDEEGEEACEEEELSVDELDEKIKQLEDLRKKKLSSV